MVLAERVLGSAGAHCRYSGAANAPIRRNITIDDVGNAAAFLLSDLASGISAEITYVDGGFSQVMSGGDAE